jgi:glyoxylase-like metal-dependent hydrolase (beta-lactamase superfamily II)
VSEPLEWHIGRVRVTRVEERVIPVPWSLLVPAGEELVGGCRPWMDPFISASARHLLLSIHSFIVETPETVIVVDTCIGDSGEFQMPGDAAFEGRLVSALPGGLDSVDTVVCTHLHFDHVGWNTVLVDGVQQPRFPNARYLASIDELAAERDEEDQRAYARSIEPLERAGCLDAVPSTHRIDPWVSLEPSPGHTPGHVAVRIIDGDSVAVITGDLAHTPLQFAHPEATSRPDFDPAMATETRERYVAELADSDVLVLGTHFNPPTGGHLRTHADGVRFV